MKISYILVYDGVDNNGLWIVKYEPKMNHVGELVLTSEVRRAGHSVSQFVTQMVSGLSFCVLQQNNKTCCFHLWTTDPMAGFNLVQRK